MSRKIGSYLQLIASLMGVVISLYLLIQHTRLKTGIQGSASFCSLGAHVDCDVVNSSQYAEIAGFPIAGIGACFYLLLFLLALARRPGQKGFLNAQRAIFVLTILAAIIDGSLLYVQAGVLNNFCIMCLATYLMTLLIGISPPLRTGMGLKLLNAKDPGPVEEVSSAWTAGPMCAFVAFLVVVFLTPKLIEQQRPNVDAEGNPAEDFFAKLKTMPARAIPIRSVDPVFGNPTAKVKIVEFSDFECPFCRKAAITMHTAMQLLQDRAYFVFKNYPLDISCNSGLTRPMHANACELARLGYCATQKNRFWDFHDRVFLSWDEEPESRPGRVIAAVNRGDLNGIFTAKEVQDCLKDPASLEKIKEDIALGDQLDVHGTPTVFINGKKLSVTLSLENLKRAVEIEESATP